MDELRIFKITEETEGDRIILTEMNPCRRSQRDNDRRDVECMKKYDSDTSERKIHRNEVQNSEYNELKMPLREFFREPSLFFTRVYTRRKVPEIRILFESEDRSYFLYFKTRNSTSSSTTLRLSPNIFLREHTYVHVSTSVSHVRIKDIRQFAFRVNDLMAVDMR